MNFYIREKVTTGLSNKYAGLTSKHFFLAWCTIDTELILTIYGIAECYKSAKLPK